MRATGLTLSCLLTACGPTADVVLPDCSCSPGAVQEGWIPLWQGHGVTWDDLSHRVAYLRAGLDLPDPDGTFEADLGILGGEWSDGTLWRDYADIDLAWTWVKRPGTVAWFGEAELRVRNELHPDGRVSQRVIVDLDDVELPDRQTWVVMLRGVCYDTSLPLDVGAPRRGFLGPHRAYDPRRGWTVDRLGAGVGPVELDPVERELGFDIWSTYGTGRLVNDIRPDMLEAMPHAQIDTRVRYALVGFDGPVVTVQDAVQMTSAHDVKGEQYSHIPPMEKSFRVDAQTGQHAVSYLTSWSLRLNEERPLDDRGRYLRAWSAWVSDGEVDPSTGQASGLVTGHASHASMFQEGDLSVRFEATVGTVLLDGDTEVVAAAQTFTDDQVLGNWEFEVPGP